MILGRNAGLWYGLGAAVINLAMLILVMVDGHPLDAATVAMFAGLNMVLHAVVGLVANASDPTTAPTFARTTRAPLPPTGTPPQGTAS